MRKLTTTLTLTAGLMIVTTRAQASTLTLGIDPSNPLSTSYYTDPNTGTIGADVLAFNAAAQGDTFAINSITVTPEMNIVTGDFIPGSTLKLMVGNEVVAAESVDGTTPVTFNNLTGLTIGSGTTQPLSLAVDVPAPSEAHNGIGSTVFQAEVTDVIYESSGGQVFSATPDISGNTQHFFSAVPQLAFVSSSVSVNGGSYAGQPVSANGQITFTTTAKGGAENQPTLANFQVTLETPDGPVIIPTSQTTIAAIVPQPAGSNPLSQGQTYTIVLDATALAAELQYTGSYQFSVSEIDTTVQNPFGAEITTDQTWGLNNFTTGWFNVTAVPEPASVGLMGTLALGALRRRRR